MHNAMSRLTPLHINLIGAGTAIVLALILFFALVKPKSDQVQRVQEDRATIEKAGGTPDQVALNEKKAKQAKADAVKTRADWDVNRRVYMPDVNFQGDLLQVYQTRLVPMPTIWGKWVEAWYDSQRNLGIARLPGVDFPIEAFPADPNYVSQLKSIRFPLSGSWPVTVEAKSFNDAMAHLRSFNRMEKHGMPVIDNVALSGQSPNLNVSYTLALYVIPSEEPPASDPRLGGSGAAAGGAAGAAGFPGMMGGMGRGGYPGMMGGPAGMGGGPPGMMGGGRTMPAGAAPAAGKGGKAD